MEDIIDETLQADDHRDECAVQHGAMYWPAARNVWIERKGLLEALTPGSAREENAMWSKAVELSIKEYDPTPGELYMQEEEVMEGACGGIQEDQEELVCRPTVKQVTSHLLPAASCAEQSDEGLWCKRDQDDCMLTSSVIDSAEDMQSAVHSLDTSDSMEIIADSMNIPANPVLEDPCNFSDTQYNYTNEELPVNLYCTQPNYENTDITAHERDDSLSLDTDEIIQELLVANGEKPQSRDLENTANERKLSPHVSWKFSTVINESNNSTSKPKDGQGGRPLSVPATFQYGCCDSESPLAGTGIYSVEELRVDTRPVSPPASEHNPGDFLLASEAQNTRLAGHVDPQMANNEFDQNKDSPHLTPGIDLGRPLDLPDPLMARDTSHFTQPRRTSLPEMESPDSYIQHPFQQMRFPLMANLLMHPPARLYDARIPILSKELLLKEYAACQEYMNRIRTLFASIVKAEQATVDALHSSYPNMPYYSVQRGSVMDYRSHNSVGPSLPMPLNSVPRPMGMGVGEQSQQYQQHFTNQQAELSHLPDRPPPPQIAHQMVDVARQVDYSAAQSIHSNSRGTQIHQILQPEFIAQPPPEPNVQLHETIFRSEQGRPESFPEINCLSSRFQRRSSLPENYNRECVSLQEQVSAVKPLTQATHDDMHGDIHQQPERDISVVKNNIIEGAEQLSAKNALSDTTSSTVNNTTECLSEIKLEDVNINKASKNDASPTTVTVGHHRYGPRLGRHRATIDNLLQNEQSELPVEPKPEPKSPKCWSRVVAKSATKEQPVKKFGMEDWNEECDWVVEKYGKKLVPELLDVETTCPDTKQPKYRKDRQARGKSSRSAGEKEQNRSGKATKENTPPFGKEFRRSKTKERRDERNCSRNSRASKYEAKEKSVRKEPDNNSELRNSGKSDGRSKVIVNNNRTHHQLGRENPFCKNWFGVNCPRQFCRFIHVQSGTCLEGDNCTKGTSCSDLHISCRNGPNCINKRFCPFIHKERSPNASNKSVWKDN